MSPNMTDLDVRERCAAQDKLLARAADMLNQSMQEAEMTLGAEITDFRRRALSRSTQKEATETDVASALSLGGQMSDVLSVHRLRNSFAKAGLRIVKDAP